MAWAPDYVTVEELKSFITIADDFEDEAFAYAITAASRSIDLSCNRQFGLVDAPQARYYTAWNNGERWIVGIDDLMTTVGMSVHVDSDDTGAYASEVPSPSYLLIPRNAETAARPWERLEVRRGSAAQPTGLSGAVRVTARWGWTSVPGTIKQATLLQASRFYSRRSSPYGVAGSPELGNELRLLDRLDADVAVMVAPYRRWWAIA